MNLTSRVRRAVVVAALASTIAGAVGAAGAAQAGDSVPVDTPPVEVPPVSPIDESPPGSTAGDADPGPTSPPPAGDPSTSTPTPPAPPDPTVPPTTTNPPTAPELIPPSTEPPVATQPPPATPKTTQPPNAIPVTTTASAVPVALAAVAATAPQSPVATPGNGTVKLTWKAPASNGGAAIDKYVVQRYSAAGGWATIASPTGLSLNVAGTNGVKYSFRVAAHNSAGNGPFSPVVSAVPRTVPGAPKSPVATPGNASVTLKWSAPASNGAAIDTYAVQRYNSATKQWENVAFPKTTSRTVGTLANGTNYSFRIRAHNAAGWSPVSTVVNAVPFTVPGAPSKCSAVQYGGVGSHTMLFQWGPPWSDGGSPLSGYEVEASKDGANHGWVLKSPDPLGGFVAWQLEYGWYSVSVRAVNQAGPGPWCTAWVLMFWP